MPKLTKRSVDGFQARPTSYFEWDSEIKGFGVRIMPSGTVRRQIFWNQWLHKLGEGSAHLAVCIMRRAVCDASAAVRVSSV